MNKTGPEPDVNATYRYAQTNTVDVGGAKFAYRQLGQDTGVPVIFLNHLGAVLDNWDPRIVDGIAAKHHASGNRIRYPERFLRHAIQFLGE